MTTALLMLLVGFAGGVLFAELWRDALFNFLDWRDNRQSKE